MKVLVLGYNRDTDLFSPGNDACRRLEEMFPQVEFRFYKRGQETLEDLLWADVVTGHPSRKMLREAPNIKWVHLQSAGVDGYSDKNIYANPDIILTRTADVFSVPIAEHTIGMMLALTRQIPMYVRQQSEHEWNCNVDVFELCGSTVLMLGTGNLAAETVKRLRPFGCKIHGVRRDVTKPAEGYDKIYSQEQLLEALEQADYIVNTLPLVEETVGYLGFEEFAVMKKRAILVNVGRGKTVDTEALVEALQSEKIYSAGLDVTDPEPLNADSPLWDMPNVIITPHSSGFSFNAAERRFNCFVEQLRRYIAGEELEYKVDYMVGY